MTPYELMRALLLLAAFGPLWALARVLLEMRGHAEQARF